MHPLPIADPAPYLVAAESGQLRMVLDVAMASPHPAAAAMRKARRLKRRASSVFTPPCRAALCATSQADASRLNIAAGKGIGCQGFGILSRIAAVDRVMRPELQRHVHEGHPEVSFAIVQGAFVYSSNPLVISSSVPESHTRKRPVA
jgi:predicted RNase H-like nuclease